jgi:hypothetical protein
MEATKQVVAELSVRTGRARERARELGRGRKLERGDGRAGRRAQNGRGGSDVGVSTAGRSWARG